MFSLKISSACWIPARQPSSIYFFKGLDLNNLSIHANSISSSVSFWYDFVFFNVFLNSSLIRYALPP